MKLNKLAFLYSNPTWKSYFKNNEKNTWKFTKNPGKIMEISWNFVSLKKWEPWLLTTLHVWLTFGTGTELQNTAEIGKFPPEKVIVS